MPRLGWVPLIGLSMLAVVPRADAAGDPEAGAQGFGTCAACHTLAPGAHRTGPSLAGVFGRDKGPEPGHPVLIPTSMMGDRAFVILAAPEEISGFIESKC
jgi:hypothetical protein